MDNLKKLYEEVSPKFLNLEAKRNEILGNTEELRKAMDIAEREYNVGEMERLSVSLSSNERVLKRIESDIEKLKQEVNTWNGNALIQRISQANRADFDRANAEAQESFERIQELQNEIDSINQELFTESRQHESERANWINKFRTFLPKGKTLPNSLHLNFYPKSEIKKEHQ